jgi:hypothetical protein
MRQIVQYEEMTMKHAITNRMKMVGLLVAVLVAGSGFAAEFTWDGGGDGWTWIAGSDGNWGGGGSAPNAAGDTATITNNWPTSNSGYIQIRQLTTVGVMTLLTSTATEANAGFNRQAGGMEFIFDNNGSNAQVNGSGTKNLYFSGVPITANDTIEFNASDLPQIQINAGITGSGGVTITGDGTANEVYFRGGTFDYTGETRITSGRLQFHNVVTSLGSASIVVNAEWDLIYPSQIAGGYNLAAAQTLSGTGTVLMDSSVKAESRALRSNGGTIAPGDGGIGTLTISGAGLSLTGGTNVFEMGEAASDQIVAERLYLSGTPGTVEIVPAQSGERQSPGSVVLIDYSGTLSGDVADLNLVLPSNYTATLSNNVSNTSIDLNITNIELPPAGTVVSIK